MENTQSLGLRISPIWKGEECKSLVVDLATGGLGDAIRSWRLAYTAKRLGMVEELIFRCWPARRELFGPGKWLDPSTELPKLPFLPAIHVLVHRSLSTIPRKPLLQIAGDLLGISIDEIRKTSIAVPEHHLEQCKKKLQEAGWKGQKLLSIHADDHQPTQSNLIHQFKRAKIPTKQLLKTALCFQKSDWFSMAIGYGQQPVKVDLDLRNCDLISLAAALSLSDLLIGGDSGPQHLAAALSTDAAVVFGPSDPKIHLGDPSFRILSTTECPSFPCGKGSAYGLLLGDGGLLHLGHGMLEILPLPCPGGEIGLCTKNIDIDIQMKLKN